jgi:hypothetical protein
MHLQTFFHLCSKPFIKIGRSYCTYKPFYASLRPRQCLDSEVMDVWIEKFNHDAKVLCEKNVRVKKKYAFSMLMTVRDNLVFIVLH